MAAMTQFENPMNRTDSAASDDTHRSEVEAHTGRRRSGGKNLCCWTGLSCVWRGCTKTRLNDSSGHQPFVISLSPEIAAGWSFRLFVIGVIISATITLIPWARRLLPGHWDLFDPAEDPILQVYGMLNACIAFDYSPAREFMAIAWVLCCILISIHAILYHLRLRVVFLSKEYNRNYTEDMRSNPPWIVKVSPYMSALLVLSFSTMILSMVLSPDASDPNSIVLHTVPYQVLLVGSCIWVLWNCFVIESWPSEPPIPSLVLAYWRLFSTVYTIVTVVKITVQWGIMLGHYDKVAAMTGSDDGWLHPPIDAGRRILHGEEGPFETQEPHWYRHGIMKAADPIWMLMTLGYRLWHPLSDKKLEIEYDMTDDNEQGTVNIWGFTLKHIKLAGLPTADSSGDGSGIWAGMESGLLFLTGLSDRVFHGDDTSNAALARKLSRVTKVHRRGDNNSGAAAWEKAYGVLVQHHAEEEARGRQNIDGADLPKFLQTEAAEEPHIISREKFIEWWETTVNTDGHDHGKVTKEEVEGLLNDGLAFVKEVEEGYLGQQPVGHSGWSGLQPPEWPQPRHTKFMTVQRRNKIRSESTASLSLSEWKTKFDFPKILISGDKTPAQYEEMTTTEHPVYKIENIVLEGGGARGAAYVGAAMRLEEEGLLRYVRRFAGASAGSLAATMLALGYTATEMDELFLTIDLHNLCMDGMHLTGFGYRLWQRHGLVPGQRLHKWLQKMVANKTGRPDTTFAELYAATGVELCCAVTNATSMTVEYWHVKTTPHKPIAEAVRCSMGFPVVFCPRKDGVGHSEDVYIDGGVLCNFPIHVWDGWWLSLEREHQFDIMLEQTLAAQQPIATIFEKQFRFGYKNWETLGLALVAESDMSQMNNWRDIRPVRMTRTAPPFVPGPRLHQSSNQKLYCSPRVKIPGEAKQYIIRPPSSDEHSLKIAPTRAGWAKSQNTQKTTEFNLDKAVSDVGRAFFDVNNGKDAKWSNGSFATKSYLELQDGVKNDGESEATNEEFETELQNWWNSRMDARQSKSKQQLAKMESEEGKERQKHRRTHLKHATRLSEQFLLHLAEVSADPKQAEGDGFWSQAMFERSKHKFLAAAKAAEGSDNGADGTIERDKLKAFAEKLQREAADDPDLCAIFDADTLHTMFHSLQRLKDVPTAAGNYEPLPNGETNGKVTLEKIEYYVDAFGKEHYTNLFVTFHERESVPMFSVKVFAWVMITDEAEQQVPVDSLFTFLGNLISTWTRAAERNWIDFEDFQRTALLDTGYVGTLDFELEDEDINYLLKQGWRGVDQWMRDRQHLYQQPVNDSADKGRLADGHGTFPEAQQFDFFRGECSCQTCKEILQEQGQSIARFEKAQERMKNLSTELLEQTIKWDNGTYLSRLTRPDGMENFRKAAKATKGLSTAALRLQK